MDLTTAHSLWLAPLCLLLGAGMAWLLYRKGAHGAQFSKPLSLLLASCRALAIALVAFFLLEPMVRILVREVRKPIVVIAHDGSSSLMAAGDTGAVRTTLKEQLEELERRLGDRFDVRSFTYGQQFTEDLDFGQTEVLTDIGQVFREVHDRFNGPDLGAVVIDGDGIHNRGRDPRMEVDRLGVPVLAIALGDTTVRPDLVLRSVDHNRIGYLGNELPVMVRIEARHLPGRNSRVSILQGGKELSGKDITVTGDPAYLEVPLLVKAERAGMQRYTVAVRPVEGEETTLNNRVELLIDVLDDRQKVLLLGAAPHPDLGALRMALNGLEGYSTELAYAEGFTGKVEEFDLVILHGLPSPQKGMQPLLLAARTAGVPVCIIMGGNMDARAFNAENLGVQINAARGAFSEAQALVDPDFTFFTLDDEDRRAIERFPPLQVPFGQYELGRGATPLLYQRIGMVRTKYPLFAFSQQQERRTAVICGEGLWRWRVADLQQNGDQSRFDRLIHKTVQFLALKVSKDRFRVSHMPEFSESEPVLFSAELYNATFELVNSPAVDIVLTDADSRSYPYSFSPSGSAYRLDAGRLPAGTYSWTAKTELDGKAFSQKGEVYVQELFTERLSTVADHGLWADIAARTGGRVLKPADIPSIEQLMLERKDLVARSYAYPSFSDLIGLRWIFFVILGLLVVEWVLRRRNGAY